METTFEGEDRVMATAQQIVKSLNTSKDVTEDMILIFSSFDNRLSNISDLMCQTSLSDCSIDARLDKAEEIILREHVLGMPEEYLSAVDDILELIEDVAVQSDGETMHRAESVLQSAMARLEDEFRCILTQNTNTLDAEKLHGSIRTPSLSFASKDGEIEGLESFDDDDQLSFCHERSASLGEDVCMNLINAAAVGQLKEIADRMIRSGYENECCQVCYSVRRDVLGECLWILGVEKMSIEEVQKMEWSSLDKKMKKWVQAVKVAVRFLLSGEKRLCEQIFSGSENIKEICFSGTAKGCVMQLLNFGEAVAIGRRSPEKLFRILDMYDVLVQVLPDLEALFTDKSWESVSSEVQSVVAALGDAAIGTFVEFENAVKGETSRKTVQGGEVHPLTRYVMNYVKFLVDYRDSLNTLLESTEDEQENLQSDNFDNLQLEEMSPVARRLLLLLTSLELNLEEKSRLYEDGAMQYVFLMNNILYVVKKVTDSDLRKLLGDQWIRKRRGRIRQYGTSYLRASWSKVLSCLKDDGIGGSTSNATKMVLKERFKNFNACFEDIYRIQTAWKVPDDQLREELRISISEKLIPAYRAFMGRFGSHLENGRHAGKYMKYTSEDLENYLLDLFGGTPIVLNHMRRKGT